MMQFTKLNYDSRDPVTFLESKVKYNGALEKESLDSDEFYKRLIKEAPYIPGDKCDLIPATDIPWANLKLLNDGLTFGRKNVFSLILANTTALSFGFSVKPESVVLLRSGKFHRIEDSFRRYLSTARRIGSWFRYGISNEDSEGYKQLQALRKLHSFYAKSKAPLPSMDEMDVCPENITLVEAIQKDMDYLDTSDAEIDHLLTWNPQLPFSQFDMAMTQLGFIGLIYLFPKSFGISDLTHLDGYIHLWAVIGRMLGLEDRFNLALHPDREVIKKLYIKVGLASLKSTDETVINLQYALIEGLSRRLPVLTLKSWIYYGLKEQNDDFQGENMWNLMTFRDKATYYGWKGCITLVRKSSIVRLVLNIFIVLLLHFAYRVYLPTTACSCPSPM